MTTTTGKLIGMIKFSVWCSRVLARQKVILKKYRSRGLRDVS